MGRPRGFLEFPREKGKQRPVGERVRDCREFESTPSGAKLQQQAARCMDCGVPYCHGGCPLGNLIPDFNELVYQGRFEEAAHVLHGTNNFPEVTGRVCPAPCEASCVLNMQGSPVSIKDIERSVAEAFFSSAQALVPRRAGSRTGQRVAVVGSGPAGLAAAQQLSRKGHDVTLFEKADRLGGLLRYGIPDFKLEKGLLDLRLEQMEREGVTFRPNVHVGVDLPSRELLAGHDATVLAGGAMQPRDLGVPGRELSGVHFAMDFLTQQNRRVAGDAAPAEGALLATGKHVVVLGGGDTGSDCVGTSHRQGAASVTSLELMPRPPDVRHPNNPWPEWPLIFRTSSSHEEGGRREFGVLTQRLVGEGGRLTTLCASRVRVEDGRVVPVEGTALTLKCDLLLLAMGFLGPVKAGLLEGLGVALDARGNVATQRGQTSLPGVFAAGDMARGQSLVVWAIAEGRRVAEAVDSYLSSSSSRMYG